MSCNERKCECQCLSVHGELSHDTIVLLFFFLSLLRIDISDDMFIDFFSMTINISIKVQKNSFS